MYPQATLKLARSASDQNVFLTYVCLVNEINPTEHKHNHKLPLEHTSNYEINTDDHIRVERSKALHELVESHRKFDDVVPLKVDRESVSTTPYPTTSLEESDKSENEESYCENPNILKLTKMKWLTEDREEAPDSSSPSLSPTSSISSQCSKESDSNLNRHTSLSDKYLSTILRLDKEHNLFGLSNIAIVGPRASKKIRKDDEKPVFHQTAIVQVCCGKNCCKHISNTDLPASLKCGSGCNSCCIDPCCPICVHDCTPCADPLPCPPICPRGKCRGYPSSKCHVDCTSCYGMKLLLHKKPKYEVAPCELTPRSSCVLQKPIAARSCHHFPHCIPPSSCFPYLMPCFWPARPAAPCSSPTRCFHNPPCRRLRRKKTPGRPEDQCPKGGKCEDETKKTTCPNLNCPGKVCAPEQPDVDTSAKKKHKKKKNKVECECSVPQCISCFVFRPKKALTESSGTQNDESEALNLSNEVYSTGCETNLQDR